MKKKRELLLSGVLRYLIGIGGGMAMMIAYPSEFYLLVMAIWMLFWTDGFDAPLFVERKEGKE